MDRVRTLSYQGSKILYLDFLELRTEPEIKEVINQATRLIVTYPYSSVLCITNITDMHFNQAIVSDFQQFVKGNKPYMKASAILGVTGLKQLVFNSILKMSGRDIKTFGIEEEAKRWLISIK